MYHDLWSACYEHTEPVKAEAVLAAAHRLLAAEGGEPKVVIAAAMLSTVDKEERERLLQEHVHADYQGEIRGILEGDPQNKNTAIVHDSILLSDFHKNIWKSHGENAQSAITFLEELLPSFRTQTGRNDAKHFLGERRADALEIVPEGATPLKKTEEAKSESNVKKQKIKEQAVPSDKINQSVNKNMIPEKKYYHWADKTALKIIEEKGNKDSYTIAAGITPSGVVHFGNFREIITNDIIVKALEGMGKKVRFLYSWDDYDTFRKVPKTVDQEKFKEYLFQPVVDLPDPFECAHENWPAHFKAEITEDLPLVSIFPEFLHQHKKYRACEYANDIKHALKHREEIREILNEFKTEEIDPAWWPISVYCEKCNRDRSVKIIGYDEEYSVTYECLCGYKNTFDLRKKGIAKLPWRVDWPMRWHKEKVDFEPGGKDHSSEGGSYDSGKVISKKIWKYDAPTYIMYDFINFKGQGGKMSSSAGNTITLRVVLGIYTSEVVRFMFAGTRPDAEFSVSFDTDVFKVYEDFDTVERKYFGTEEVGSEKEQENAKRIYELSMVAVPHKQPLQPSFRHLTTYVQIAEGNLDKVVSMMQHEIKDALDEARVRRRAQCAWNWVNEYAPEQYRFKLADKPYNVEIPEPVLLALRDLGNILAAQDEPTLLETFYQLCEKHGIQNTEFFKYAYLTLVGKDRGPKLANLITQAGHERIAQVLKQL